MGTKQIRHGRSGGTKPVMADSFGSGPRFGMEDECALVHNALISFTLGIQY